MTDQEGRDSSATEEKTRPAGPGETGTTRFGQDGGKDTGETATTGMARSEGAGAPMPSSTGGSGNGLSSGLQGGGMAPGGGPAAMTGSLGTGGGSNANQATGDADEDTIHEDVK
jgi:hypothetical protein